MEEVDVNEVETHLPKFLERITKGHRFTITKHGAPMAVLGPYDPEESVELEIVIKQLRKFRENCSFTALNLRKIIDEGRP